MLGSGTLYGGLIVALAGVVLLVKPSRRFHVPTRWGAAGVAASGVLLSAVALLLPASESRVAHVSTRLDQFAPVWQFREFHTIVIAAPSERVFDAIERVQPDEIFLFNTLIRIRAFGRPPPPDVQAAGAGGNSLIDVALKTTFVQLSRDIPRELVVGTIVGRPPGRRTPLTAGMFQQELPDGFALATMNFVVTPDGPNRSIVSTETRVYANSPSARRRFAAYWRLIYPGSALIRRMWLRAIARRATSRP